jgi:hypothetical protein
MRYNVMFPCMYACIMTKSGRMAHQPPHWSSLCSETFKVLPSSYFEVYNMLLFTIVTPLCNRNQNLFPLSNCNFAPIDKPLHCSSLLPTTTPSPLQTLVITYLVPLLGSVSPFISPLWYYPISLLLSVIICHFSFLTLFTFFLEEETGFCCCSVLLGSRWNPWNPHTW